MMVTWVSLAGSNDLIIKDLVVRIFRLDPTQEFSGGRSPDDPYDISLSAHHIYSALCAQPTKIFRIGITQQKDFDNIYYVVW